MNIACLTNDVAPDVRHLIAETHERTTKMMKNWLARTGLIISLSAMPLALAIPASAADNPAKGTGLTGACNMLAGVGMGHAMTVNATQGTNGNDGMWRAVDVSGCA